MLYVQLDVNWPENPKRLQAGLECSAIHAICLCLAKRMNTDGWISQVTLTLYGATGEHIDRLVQLDLLDVDGDRVRPHDWHAVNLTSDAIRRRQSESARIANHARWHEGAFGTCERCNPETLEIPCSSESDSDRTPTGSDVIPEVEGEGESERRQQQPSDPPATTADLRHARLAAAAEIIGDRAAQRPGVDNPVACARAVARAVVTDRHQDAYAIIANNPSVTAVDLAELLEPNQPSRTEPSIPGPAHPIDEQHVDFEHHPVAKINILDATTAEQALEELNRRMRPSLYAVPQNGTTP